MFRIILLTLFYTCFQSLSAQEFSTTFFGETQGGDYLPEYIAGLPDGGAYIVGQTNRLSSGGYHVLLIRTDAQGNRLWERTYHAGAGTWVAATADGGCVLGGYSLRHPFGTEQGFVSKIDAQGEQDWTQYFPQGNHSEIREVKPLANGGYAVCGIVSQPDSTGQNVFWARLSEGGGLEMYEEIKKEGREYNPSIIETKDHQLVMCWAGGYDADIIRCIKQDGTLRWEQNLSALGYEASSPGVIQDALGDLWVTGLDNYSNNYSSTILRLSVQNGSVKQEIPPLVVYTGLRPVAGRTEPDSTIVLCGRYTNSLVCKRYDIQGVELGLDSFGLWNFGYPNGIDLSIPNKILLLRQESLFSYPGNISVLPMTFNSSTIALEPSWELTVDNPLNHELFEAKANASDGGTFVLFRGKSQSDDSYSSGYYIMKYKPDGSIKEPVNLGDESGSIISLSGQLQTTKDGGVIVLSRKNQMWKLDQNLQIEWTKQTARGTLYAGAENDFFVVENSSQPGPFDPILVHHFHPDGQLDKTLKVYSKSQPYYVAGGVSQLNNGPVLFGVKYDDAGTPRNWIIYIDREGNLSSEQLLPELYSPLSLNSRNKFIQTSDGGVLAASPSGDRIYMLKVKDGKVVWDASFVNGTPDESTMQLLDIEEVPCKGYVLSVLTNAYQSNAPKIIPESTQTILLYHLDEHGHGQKTFSYRPLPEPSSPNTDFIPGYTYRRWGDRLNGQTYDLLLETVHFPDSLAMQQPAGALSIMPNPSPVETCLEYHSDDYGLMEIQVFNAAGVLMDHFYSRKTEAIWRQHYRLQAPKGTYFIRTRLNDQDWVSRRWVKMH
ncbi:MAG TPA: hypothetical protein VK168_15310 [Saprospiraceae bacterium]|nr:hypothetical protein [Saprospiraceae bacterium]